MVLLWMMLAPVPVQAKDEEPPRLEISFRQDIWQEAPVLQVQAKDDQQLKRLVCMWQETDGLTGRVSRDLSGRDYGGSVTLPVRTDGWPLLVTAVVYDVQGNRMSCEEIVYVDRVSPRGQILRESESMYCNFGQEITVLIMEEHWDPSSFQGMVFRDEDFWQRFSLQQEGNTWKTTVSCETDGAYRLVAKAVDRAGNTWEEELSFVVDTTPPNIQVQGHQTYYQGDCRWEMKIADRWLQEETVVSEWKTPSGTEALPVSDGRIVWEDFGAREDGWYEGMVMARDLAGNEASQELRFCLHRKGSEFVLSGKELLEENQLEIVEETIWKFTDCGLIRLEEGKDYRINEQEEKRTYHFWKEDAVAYQIITRDVSGRKNGSLRGLVSDTDKSLELEREQGNSLGAFPVLIAVFFGCFLAAWILTQKERGCRE